MSPGKGLLSLMRNDLTEDDAKCLCDAYYKLSLVLLLMPILLGVPIVALYFDNYITLSGFFIVMEGVFLYLQPFSIPGTAESTGYLNDIKNNRRIAIVLFGFGLFTIVFGLVRSLS